MNNMINASLSNLKNLVSVTTLKVALLILMSFFITGCTQPASDDSSDDSSTDTSGPVNLQWWGVFWEPELVEPLIEEYQNLNPNVTITYANKWAGGDRDSAAKIYQDEVDRVLRDNNQVSIPDIFMVENTWVGNYEAHSAPAPSSVIDVDSVSSTYYPAVAEDFTRDGNVYGLPLWIDSLAILYNKDHLSDVSVTSPPTEWVAFKDLAQSLTTRSGTDFVRAGFAAGTASNVSFGTELFSLLLLQNGVTVQDSAGMPVFSTDGDSEIALDFLKSFAKGSSATWDASLSNDAVAFLEGKLSMMVAPSWRYDDIQKFNEYYDLGLNIGVSQMPQLSGQTKPIINWAHYWGLMVAKNRPNSGVAWDFINWLSQPEQLKKLRISELSTTDNFGFMYPRTDMQQLLQTDTNLRVYNSGLEDADTWYMVDGLAVKEILAEMINEISPAAKDIANAENEIQEIISNKGQL